MKELFQTLFQQIQPLFSDESLVKLKFRWHMGHFPNLKKPTTLNEKINWLKLYDRTPLHTQCSDKFMVRSYVQEKIGDSYLVPLYFETLNPEEIIPETLPDKPCIIKANHDSSGGIFVRDKDKIDWKQVQENLKSRLKTNYYPRSREWQYKNIVPRVIVEKLLENKIGQIPYDYKVHCFNGNVQMISVDLGRGTQEHYRNWYFPNWERTPFSWSSPKEHGKATNPSDTDIEKPSTLNKMIELSQVLSQPFKYARIDWYDVDSTLYFGEITFHHDGGFRPIEPKIWDKKLGKKLVIE